MTLKIKEAYGLLKMDDGTEVVLDGEPFDINSIKDPNMICSITADESEDESNVLFVLDNGNTITFPDAQNVRLFIGHNQMLEAVDQNTKTKKALIKKMADYMIKYPVKDNDTIFLIFTTARSADIRKARRWADDRTNQ